ncbi:MAG: polysaccharide deacetylase family protein [Planctomycetota bacterium]
MSALMLSVDVEPDWGAVASAGARCIGLESGLPWLLDLLERQQVCATFFVVGELAESFARQVPAGGVHEVGAHGLTHRRLSTLPPEEQERELRESRARLCAVGYAVDGFRAPFLDVPSGLHSRLARAGYRYDASNGRLGPSTHNRPQAPQCAAGRQDVARLSIDALRLLCLPANLTWLRLLAPFGQRLLPRRPVHFSLHLHELVPSRRGLASLPAPLARAHAIGCGARARRILEQTLLRAREAGQNFVTGRQLAASCA